MAPDANRGAQPTESDYVTKLDNAIHGYLLDSTTYPPEIPFKDRFDFNEGHLLTECN